MKVYVVVFDEAYSPVVDVIAVYNSRELAEKHLSTLHDPSPGTREYDIREYEVLTKFEVKEE